MKRLLALAVLLLAAAGAASADTFLGGDWTTGSGYRGFDAKAGLDLAEGGAYELDATYSYAHSFQSTESRSRELVATLVHVADDAWSTRASLTGWRDNLNDVDYFGPSYGFTWRWLGAADEEGGKRPELASFSLDNDLFVYKADETFAPRSVVVAGKRVVLPGGQSAVTLAQWHPSAHAEAPLGSVTPSLDLGVDLYSKDPALIEARAGKPRFSASSGSLNGLVGGLISKSGALGVAFKLFWGLRATASLGVQQSATDNTWATVQGAALSAYPLDPAKVSVSWSRTIQAGLPSDIVTTGASWTF